MLFDLIKDNAENPIEGCRAVASKKANEDLIRQYHKQIKSHLQK